MWGEVELIISKLLQTTSTGVYKYSKIFGKRKYERCETKDKDPKQET
jgi:hypothetical protein